MSHVILLDAYRQEYGDGRYAVSFLGTLAECRAQRVHDGRTFPLPIADYVEGEAEPKTLVDGLGGEYPGVIVELVPKGGLAAFAAAPCDPEAGR